MKDLFDKTTREKLELEKRIELTVKRIGVAEKLTLLLVDEGIRWHQQSEFLDFKLKQIAGDSFLSAITIAYLGEFNQKFRNKMLKLCQKLLKE